MALTDKIVKGMIINFRGEPYLVVEREFYKPGKGNALNRTKLKNLINGKVIPQTFKSGEKVEEVDVQKKSMMYLYADDKVANFMDPNSFEQIEVSLEMISGGTDYLHTEAKYIASIYEGQVISLQLPPNLPLEVVETSSGDRGNTATNATKEAVLETGAKVQVPLFIKQGDKIVVSTETGNYVSKEN